MPESKSKGGIARKRVRVTSEHIKKALSMVAGGKVPGAGIEWADEGCPGLALRVTPRVAAWYLQLRTTTVRIGTADALTVAAAREAAMRARVDLKGGKNPKRDLKVFEHAMARTGDVEIAADAAWPEEAVMQTDEDRKAHGPWQWRDLVEAFLYEFKKDQLDPRYFPKYAAYLSRPAFDLIAKREVRTLQIEDLERVRAELLKGSKSAAKRCVDQAKDALTWAWEDEVTRSGLKTEYPWWTRWKVRYSSGTREHVPTVEELARTLALAERYRTLGQTEHGTSPGAIAALWAFVLTAQRRGALLRTRMEWVVPLDDQARPGWMSMNWPAENMKRELPHALPLPPDAWEILARIRAEDPRKVGSDYVFPAHRGTKQLAENAVNQLLYRLAGLDKNGQPHPTRPDLLAQHGIRRWTIHDTRRALATFLTGRRLGGAASAILDHSHGKETDERQRTAAVTRLHYERSQKMDLKAEGMELWVTAVLDAYNMEKAALADLPAPEMKPRIRRVA